MQRYSFWVFLLAALYVSSPAYATDESASPEVKPTPHIALILPLKSAVFGRAAGIVQQGFMATANSQPQSLPVIVYEAEDESKDITALYPKAIADAAVAVAGPLTRDGVAALAADPEISVPTLALNIGDIRGTDKLYFFGRTLARTWPHFSRWWMRSSPSWNRRTASRTSALPG